ncbi:hypothetical protein HD806DRAFT_501797 [Xylariaceae sp. AK1471]|nr:hypothetical protein HD806DRAFT_501797 [Xylariaceae sp. AK1471]
MPSCVQATRFMCFALSLSSLDSRSNRELLLDFSAVFLLDIYPPFPSSGGDYSPFTCWKSMYSDSDVSFPSLKWSEWLFCALFSKGRVSYFFITGSLKLNRSHITLDLSFNSSSPPSLAALSKRAASACPMLPLFTTRLFSILLLLFPQYPSTTQACEYRGSRELELGIERRTAKIARLGLIYPHKDRRFLDRAAPCYG